MTIQIILSKLEAYAPFTGKISKFSVKQVDSTHRFQDTGQILSIFQFESGKFDRNGRVLSTFQQAVQQKSSVQYVLESS